MEPVLIDLPSIHLVGMSFYGNPFRSAPGWSKENEIGKLWNRFGVYFDEWDNPDIKPAETTYEIHLFDESVDYDDEFTVFAGAPYKGDREVPVYFSVKTLPGCTYAQWEFSYDDIQKGYMQPIFTEWLPGSGYRLAAPFIVQQYGVVNADGERCIQIRIPIEKR